MMDPKKIINHREASRLLTGNPHKIRANRPVPVLYEKPMVLLENKIKEWACELEREKVSQTKTLKLNENE